MLLTNDAVEAHSCIDIVAEFTDEQYATINQVQDASTRGSLSTAYKSDKDPQAEMSCSWLINSCVLLISELRYYVIILTVLEMDSALFMRIVSHNLPYY